MSGNVVDVALPGDSMTWDVAFRRNNIKTNGGVSGIGDVCAFVDNSEIWTDNSFISINEIPSSEECQIDELVEGAMIPTFQGCYNPVSHFFEDCEKNPALDQWGYFDSSYYFNVNNYQLFVKDVNGDYVKIWLMSYNDANGENAHISMKYLYINE